MVSSINTQWSNSLNILINDMNAYQTSRKWKQSKNRISQCETGCNEDTGRRDRKTKIDIEAASDLVWIV